MLFHTDGLVTPPYDMGILLLWLTGQSSAGDNNSDYVMQSS